MPISPKARGGRTRIRRRLASMKGPAAGSAQEADPGKFPRFAPNRFDAGHSRVRLRCVPARCAPGGENSTCWGHQDGRRWIIAAYAGSPSSWWASSRGSRDHPRLCREYPFASEGLIIPGAWVRAPPHRRSTARSGSRRRPRRLAGPLQPAHCRHARSLHSGAHGRSGSGGHEWYASRRCTAETISMTRR